MAVLPTEIIAEILSKLPVKTLLRFLCVCNSWNSLIKTPSFIKRHLNQTLISNSDCYLLKWSKCTSLQYAELEIHHNHLYFSELNHPLETQEVYLFGSCNGVVCISDSSKNDLFLYNPLTKSHRKLPANQIPNLNKFALVFGIGYDSKNDDLKVLRLVHGFTNDKVFYSEAKMYSLNNNSWKSVEGIPYHLYSYECHGVVVNEALHYIVITNESKPCKFIASFDLRSESLSYMDCPIYNEKWSNLSMLLTEWGGCLCVMVDYQNDNFIVECFDMWVMKEYGNKESWVRLFSIFQPESIGIFLEIKPVVYSKDGRKILLEIDNLKFGWYDLESNKLDRCTTHWLSDGAFKMTKFVGSLVLLEDKLPLEKGILPKKNKKKNDLDRFLSTGFKLRL